MARNRPATTLDWLGNQDEDPNVVPMPPSIDIEAVRKAIERKIAARTDQLANPPTTSISGRDKCEDPDPPDTENGIELLAGHIVLDGGVGRLYPDWLNELPRIPIDEAGISIKRWEGLYRANFLEGPIKDENGDCICTYSNGQKLETRQRLIGLQKNVQGFILPIPLLSPPQKYPENIETNSIDCQCPAWIEFIAAFYGGGDYRVAVTRMGALIK